jgi:sterol desaturase/sphingolipid hydroxylase (fatty acid hydroxylase superfamily)
MWLIALGAVIAIAAEAFVSWRAGRPAYTLRETELSLALAAGAFALAYMLPPAAQWAPRLLRVTPIAMPRGWQGAALLTIMGDFTLYWSHRASHALRWQWAAHEAHHSSERLNFLAALREGWTDLPAGLWLYTLPLALLGFDAGQWVAYYGINLGWQMFVHNEWAPRLGPLEWILVTPSHHRVHHVRAAGRNARNFANIFIVWDRLFGTFQAEGERRVTVFGVEGRTFDGVFDVVFGTWRKLLTGLWQRARASA